MPPTGERGRKIKTGLARAREAGKKIGAHGKQLAADRQRAAVARAFELVAIVEELENSGVTYRAMVELLNRRGTPTVSGKGQWHVKSLQRLVARVRLIHSGP